MSRSRTRRGRTSRRYSRGMLLSGWAAIALTVMLVAGALYGYVQYRDVLDGINTQTLKDLGNRPKQYKNALNILVIGSDSRSGKNEKIGGGSDVAGQRSDTVMVVHISPGRSRMSVLSFPRDSVVPILSCPAEPGFGGQTAGPAHALEAFRIMDRHRNGGTPGGFKHIGGRHFGGHIGASRYFSGLLPRLPPTGAANIVRIIRH